MRTSNTTKGKGIILILLNYVLLEEPTSVTILSLLLHSLEKCMSTLTVIRSLYKYVRTSAGSAIKEAYFK
jgi:hypothetical protein